MTKVYKGNEPLEWLEWLEWQEMRIQNKGPITFAKCSSILRVVALKERQVLSFITSTKWSCALPCFLGLTLHSIKLRVTALITCGQLQIYVSGLWSSSFTLLETPENHSSWTKWWCQGPRINPGGTTNSPACHKNKFNNHMPCMYTPPLQWWYCGPRLQSKKSGQRIESHLSKQTKTTRANEGYWTELKCFIMIIPEAPHDTMLQKKPRENM